MHYERGAAEVSALAGYCAKYVETHPDEFFLPHVALEERKANSR
jgi:hypothetical protein